MQEKNSMIIEEIYKVFERISREEGQAKELIKELSDEIELFDKY